MTESKSTPIRVRVYGNALTRIIQACADNGDVVAVLGILPSASTEDLLAVVEHRAAFTGNDEEGFGLEYTDREEPANPFREVKRARDHAADQARHATYDELTERFERWLREEGHEDLAESVRTSEWELELS